MYLGTLYLYCEVFSSPTLLFATSSFFTFLAFYKKTPRSWILIASITVAYTSSAVMVGVGWSSAKMVYIGVVQALEDGDLPSGPDISYVFVALLNNFCIFAISTVADGLLVRQLYYRSHSCILTFSLLQMWRCYNIWAGDIRSIAAQLFLLICEIGKSP